VSLIQSAIYSASETLPASGAHHHDIGLAIASAVLALAALPFAVGRVRRLGRAAVAGSLNLSAQQRRNYFRATDPLPWIVFLVGVLGCYVSLVPATLPWRIGAVVLIAAIAGVIALAYLPPALLPRWLSSAGEHTEGGR
jgi:uncharacterized membrane protein YdcZ (DUF606 family)